VKIYCFSSVLELFEALRNQSKLKTEFNLLHELGRGNFGEVFAVSRQSDQRVYAAKKISLTINCVEEIKMTLNESMLLKRLSHRNVVQCHDAWLEMEYDPDPEVYEDDQEPLKFYVLMDYCVQSLSEWIQEIKVKPDEQTALNILNQIVDGTEYIHGEGILHLDINVIHSTFI
jgi:serine/threonine protein kinase